MIYQIEMVPGRQAKRIRVSQGDTSLRRFGFELTVRGATFLLDGSETVELIQDSGASHECEIIQGRAYLDAYADMTEEAGVYRCKLKITNESDGVISSAAFFLEVEKEP